MTLGHGAIRRDPGFSLVELLVVLAALAILASLAWPSYQDAVRKARRADARTALLDAAQRLERCHTRHGSYDHEHCTVPATSPDGFYRIIEPDPRGALSFRLRAVPTGAQAADAKSCAFLELDHRGQRTSSGAAAAGCW
jgi:type IV pilus assembly protein PilE